MGTTKFLRCTHLQPAQQPAQAPRVDSAEAVRRRVKEAQQACGGALLQHSRIREGRVARQAVFYERAVRVEHTVQRRGAEWGPDASTEATEGRT